VIRHCLTAMCLLVPNMALGDPWPALHDVQGVAPHDALNVRTEPSASSEKIGSLPHDGQGIEVVAQDESGKWGLVNIGEISGWASLRYLAARPVEPGQTFPAITSCYGTEPFWDLTFADDQVEFDQAFDDVKSTSEVMSWYGNAAGYFGRYAFVAGDMTGIVNRASCNDGMSDREFGLQIDLLLGKRKDVDQEYQLFHGCCSIQPPAG